MTTDPTIEKAGRMAADNPRGLWTARTLAALLLLAAPAAGAAEACRWREPARTFLPGRRNVGLRCRAMDRW
ncbi:MAG TPA: hypothetical protein VGN83_18390 [Falsiroseomonas sp.]|jgi:hypothetical protein|nr:hypothetical protein [Falsiroseomonas sp.]